MTHKIGCVALCPYTPAGMYSSEGFISIECAKGRGIILPGGKWEEGETFKETALRELKEETGIIGSHAEFLCSGMYHDGAFVNTFIVTGLSDVKIGRKTPEGRTHIAYWHDLFTSDFGGSYEIMKDCYERWCDLSEVMEGLDE